MRRNALQLLRNPTESRECRLFWLEFLWQVIRSMTMKAFTPADKRHPEVWHKKDDKNVCIDLFIEFRCFGQNANALLADNEHDNRHCDVENDRVQRSKRFPFECHSSCESIEIEDWRSQNQRRNDLPGDERVIGITASTRNNTSNSL